MKVVRMVVDTKGLADSEFLKILAPIDLIRDRKGYVNYREFERIMLK